MTDEIIDIEPIQKMSPQVKKDGTMSFAVCLDKLMLGERCRRLAWEDPSIYIIMKDDKVMILDAKDKRLHPLIVSAGDIDGKDWVIVGKQEDLS